MTAKRERRTRLLCLACATARVFSPVAMGDPTVTYILSPNDDCHGKDAPEVFAIDALARR